MIIRSIITISCLTRHYSGRVLRTLVFIKSVIPPLTSTLGFRKHMTIRHNIKKKLFLCLGIAVTAMIILAITGVLQNGESISPIFIACFFAFLGSILFCNLGIRCPKCKGNLGITVVPALFTFSSKHKVKYCPFCGVSLDEEC